MKCEGSQGRLNCLMAMQMANYDRATKGHAGKRDACLSCDSGKVNIESAIAEPLQKRFNEVIAVYDKELERLVAKLATKDAWIARLEAVKRAARMVCLPGMIGPAFGQAVKELKDALVALDPEPPDEKS